MSRTQGKLLIIMNRGDFWSSVELRKTSVQIKSNALNEIFNDFVI